MAFPRPSTSGGVSRRGGTNNFDKRMSKDDSFLSSRRTIMASNNRISRDDSYIRDRMAAMSQFHIPVTGSTMTPAPSPPHHPAMQDAYVPVRRLDTPESMTSGDIPIGMALGSPVHLQPDASRWQAQFPPASPQTTDVSTASSPAMSGPNGSLQRKKTGRRKLFGLFSGGKKTAIEEGNRGGLSNLAKSSVASTSTLASTMTLPKKPKTPSRSNTQADVRDPRHKPSMMRANTMPYDIDPTDPDPSGTQMQRAMDPFMRHANENKSRALPPVPGIPRLELQIPDTKLDRYSVMFSDVLKGNGNKQEAAATPAASLLARRQATLERLKTINGSNGGFALEPVDEDDRARPRRATSPQPQAQDYPLPAPAFAVPQAHSSPRLSVFPTPPTGRPGPIVTTTRTLPRVARSNTSPGRLPSPTNAAFDRRLKAPSARGTPSLEVPNPFAMNPHDSSRLVSRAQEPIYPTDTSFHFGSDQSGLILDSPTSMESHEEIIISQPFKPSLHEPQWQMISPATTNASSTVTAFSASRRGRSPSAASTSTHTTKPSSEFEANDAALQNAVEVSIARQISISRSQRNLLRPLNTRRPAETVPGLPSAPGSFVGEGRSPLGVTIVKTPSPGRLGRDEPIKETKSSTPTLVHRRGSPVDPQNRKSSWVVLESD